MQSGVSVVLTKPVSALQVWSSNKGNEVASVLNRSPMNCVTFDPEGHLLAAGCWNGNVVVWNWLQNKKLTVSDGNNRLNKWVQEARVAGCR